MIHALQLLSVTVILAISGFGCAGSWTGEGDIGYNAVSGNSNSDSLTLGIKTAYEKLQWTHTAEATAYASSEDDETNAQSYRLRGQSSYQLSENSFGYGGFRYLDDRFSGYDYQASLNGGLGLVLVDDGPTQLRGQVGLGARASELRTTNPDTSQRETELVGSAQVIWNRTLPGTASLESTWSAELGSDNAYLEASVAIVVSMTDVLGIKLSYLAEHNTDVPAETKNTDRYMNLSLNYKLN